MTSLTRGANSTLDARTFEVTVSGGPGLDLLAFQVDASRKVRSDNDFVFFNQPSSPEGAIRLSSPQSLSVDLSRVPAAVDTIVVAVASERRLSTFAGLSVESSGFTSPATGLTTETAAVLIEIYRRAGQWKIRNVSAGWDAGFADLVREHGVSVDDEPAELGVRSVAGEETLSLVKREKLDMRKKQVHTVLLAKNAVGLRARIILVIDKTGSMSRQYSKRVVHRVVERMVPVATQLDDDGELEPYLYGSWYAKLPVITVADTESWSETYLHLYGQHGGIDYSSIGGVNDELPIMNQILSTVVPRQPTLVLFFTDGGFTKRGPISSFMRKASSAPVFWQFVGVGKANYGILEKLDTMDGRLVDNAGFFALDDIDKISDAELYERLLSEFPDWVRAARAAKVID